MAFYPRDEFDDAASGRDIVGAHRARPSFLRRAAPFLVVLVVAPLAAWVMFAFGLRGQVPQAADALKSLGGGESSEATVSGSGGAADGDEAAPAGGSSGRAGEGERSDEAADTRGGGDPTAIDRATEVTVLDGSDGGEGEGIARTLRSSGYRQVNESTYAADEPLETTVYVRSGEFADTASDVARVVSAQIGTPTRPARVEVVESEEAATSAPIVVVVR